MEIIRGKHTSFIDASELARLLAGYDHVHVDIGTGDGRFVRHVAQICPRHFVIGVDACRENLYATARKSPPNALFVIANAQFLPEELRRLAIHLSINFPWGSLLEGLLAGDSGLMDGLATIARPGAKIAIRLNAGALSEAGWPAEQGVERVRETLNNNGFVVREPMVLDASELRAIPTTWAKRLAFGRDPRAWYLPGLKPESARVATVAAGEADIITDAAASF